MTFSAPAHTYQLRAYIYQARDMYGGDKSGLSGNLFPPIMQVFLLYLWG